MRAGAVLWLCLLSACGGQVGQTAGGPTDPPPSTGTWREMPPGPLTARHSAVAVTVGDEVLLLGGRESPPCPRNASCAAPVEPALSDGAAYDAEAGTWRRLATAPVPLSSSATQAAVRGDALHLLVGTGSEPSTHLRYDVGDDAWQRLPAPPHDQVRLVAAGVVLVAFQSTQEGGRVLADHLYDEKTQTWQALPRDPLAPSFDRAMTWTGEELVLTGPEVTASPGGADGPSYVRSAVLDLAAREWTRRPDQTDVISYGTDRSWDGEHVVSPYTFTSDGGQTNNYGRELSTGGRLDVRSGQWAALPPHPSPGDGTYTALSRRWVTAGTGLVLDTERDRWIPLADHDADVDQGEAAAWVGDRLVVWGGGGAYLADQDVVAPVAASGAVWTADD